MQGLPISRLRKAIVRRRYRVLVSGLRSILVLFALLGIYSRIWEATQPKEHIRAQVIAIEPYSIRNDLHWSAKGYRVSIVGDGRPIDFTARNWNPSVLKGDTAALVVRRSFPWFGLKNELDGLGVLGVEKQGVFLDTSPDHP